MFQNRTHISIVLITHREVLTPFLVQVMPVFKELFGRKNTTEKERKEQNSISSPLKK